MQKTQQQVPAFLDSMEKDGYYFWKWKDGEGDWGYPLSVDGHIFSKNEIYVIAKHSEFSGPNTFESALQEYNDIFIGRYGVCMKRPAIVNIPCNRVQSEWNNASGNIDPDFLLDVWNKGKRIKWETFQGISTNSVHCELKLEFVDR
jgi:hypothetical protein